MYASEYNKIHYYYYSPLTGMPLGLKNNLVNGVLQLNNTYIAIEAVNVLTYMTIEDITHQ